MELWNHSLFTEMIVRPIGEVIQIPYQGTCQTVGRLCIAPEGSNVNCYMVGSQNNDEMRLMEMGYNLTCCNNSQQLCLLTTTTQEMNNTLYTGFCPRGNCTSGSAAWVGTTLKVIVLGK